MSEYTDFLIVGGGISGLCLHWRLRQKGLRSHLIDLPDENRSTAVAAGIINPVAGKFFSLAWRAYELFPELRKFYSEIEAQLNIQFYHPFPIKRIFRSAGEQNQWLSKAHQDKYQGYCQFESGEGFGSLKVLQAGWLDTTLFISGLHNYFMGEGSMTKAAFDHGLLDPEDVTYMGVKYDAVVFCEGAGLSRNPWFGHLPISPNKGEILDIYCEQLSELDILISGVFVLPLGNQLFRVGASYDHHDLSLEPTSAKREELLDKFKAICPYPFEVKDHKVGIRPAVRDRRPLLGGHQDFRNLFLFNGLGSKGVSMAPQLSAELMDHILNDSTLHPEADIARFL